jgi:hypothetical protein
MIGNMAQGVVLCLGADGHAEFELAFHQPCDGEDHSHHAEQKQLVYHEDHENDKHCGPCVDIPLSVSYAKASRVWKQMSRSHAIPLTHMIGTADIPGSSAYDFTSNNITDNSCTTILRTVILLV